MEFFIKAINLDSTKEEINYLKSQIVDAKSGIKIITDCPKCNGKGGLSQFAHVQNGICFLCKGTKKTFSYNLDSQKYKNKKLKDRINLLENGYYVTKDLINEFCTIEEHQTPFFRKFTNWFYQKAKEEGLGNIIILNDLDYDINCNPKFMYE